MRYILQAPRKEDDPELLQAFPRRLEALAGILLDAGECSPPRSIPHCPRIEDKKLT